MPGVSDLVSMLASNTLWERKSWNSWKVTTVIDQPRL